MGIKLWSIDAVVAIVILLSLCVVGLVRVYRKFKMSETDAENKLG
jgi:hypothetical protein